MAFLRMIHNLAKVNCSNTQTSLLSWPSQALSLGEAHVNGSSLCLNISDGSAHVCVRVPVDNRSIETRPCAIRKSTGNSGLQA